MKSRTIAAGEFKNRCLKVMEDVHQHGVAIIVTKRGKPLVRVVPIVDEPGQESLLGSVVYEADDIFSTGESWEADS
jgi:prevent-host-death family protein